MKIDLPSVLVSIKDGVIDLGWGHPSSRLHPIEAIRMASKRLLASDDSEPLQYGATQGFGPFLESLAGTDLFCDRKNFSRPKLERGRGAYRC